MTSTAIADVSRRDKEGKKEERTSSKRWNNVEKMLARDMRNMKRKYVLWTRERVLSKKQEWEQRQGWWGGWRDTREVLGGEKEMQIERRSLSVFGGLKPHVSAWGEDTTTVHTHARKNGITCAHQGHGTLVSRIHFSRQLSAACKNL